MVKESSQINLNYLKFFITAVESRSLHETARKMGYTVSTVSLSISRLEKQLGVKLLNRDKTPVETTEIGQKIYTYVKEMYNYMDLVATITNRSNDIENGKLSIGCPAYITNLYLMDRIAEVKKDYKNLNIEIDCESTCSEMLEKLKSNKLQIAILDNISEKVKDYEAKELFSSKNIFVSNKKIEINDLNELSKYNFILSPNDAEETSELSEILSGYNLKLNIGMSCLDSNFRINSSKSGLGIAYVIKDEVKKELENEELYEVVVPIELPSTTFKLVYLEDHLTKVDKKFIEDYLKISL